ncbi:MAG: circadian clock protein KaiB [Actinomycetota bacterium]|nr:circadian clock protein KaiB [Actinomycetota bacterium]
MDDSTEGLEGMLAKSLEGKYVLRLYISGKTPRSEHAVVNIKKLCETYLKGRHELTVVDLYQVPEEATDQQIIVTPTLIKSLPPPLRRLIGDLSNRNRVLLALDLEPEEQ